MSRNMIEMKCTIHDLHFAWDGDRTHELEKKKQSAWKFFGECPVCARDKIDALQSELETVRGHRDTLLSAFSLANTLKAVAPVERAAHNTTKGGASHG